MRKVLTLVIIQRGDEILLGMKKRGFGVGKWNGFGGKLHDGETVEAAAQREVFEEIGVTVDELEKIGVIDFSWQHKADEILEVNIFKCTHFTGQPVESEEMKPQWYNISEIPYETMWSDDKYWLPLLLEGKKFKGSFIFDGNNNVLHYKLS